MQIGVKMNKNAVMTVSFLSVILFLITGADFLSTDRLFSVNENRILATKPTFHKEDVISGKLMKDYEEYVTDQFVGRDTWIMIKTSGDILLQKKDINGIYLGKDGYLLEQHLPSEVSQENIEKKVALLKRLADRYHTKVMLIPTADNILSDKLPANAQYYNQQKLLTQVETALGQNRVIDVYGTLKEHSGEDIYYRTDHHWTTLGAYYGYLAWAEQSHKFPYLIRPENMVPVTESFLGTLHSRINIPMEEDKIWMFPETAERPVTLTYDFQKTTNSFYEDKYLETKNKYGFFLDDNHAFIEIHTSCCNAKELFLIKDSYANCMIPMLAFHYEKIYVVDLRYYKGRLFDLMDSYDTERQLDVLVLYNCMHFIEEFQY